MPVPLNNTSHWVESGVTVGNSTMRDRTLMLDWGDGTSSEFHYTWLRDNCACAECKHPDARVALAVFAGAHEGVDIGLEPTMSLD